MRFEQVARSHVGCRRKINEDALLARPDLGLWAVADGMGGHAAGDVASALVVDRLDRRVAGPQIAARKQAAKTRHRRRQPGSGGMACGAGRAPSAARSWHWPPATTAIACLWAGDSRAYLLRDGKLRQLTRDHSLVQQLVDSGDLDAEDALPIIPTPTSSPARSAPRPALELDSVEGDIRAGDLFLLASDGLTRLLREDELAAAQDADDLEASGGPLGGNRTGARRAGQSHFCDRAGEGGGLELAGRRSSPSYWSGPPLSVTSTFFIS